jgi:hypothetical protein
MGKRQKCQFWLKIKQFGFRKAKNSYHSTTFITVLVLAEFPVFNNIQ